jgi:hypothetical protein
MSFTMTERSESPTRNGLAHIFSKTRNRDKKGTDSASNSIKSTGTESDGLHSVRRSVEDAIDKIKGHHGSDDEGDLGIKKLKGIASRRRKRQERQEEQRASEEAERGRTVAERGTLENDVPSFTRNESGDGSSLITYDSDTIDP